MGEERCALEDACALLVDHDIGRLDRELAVDRVAIGGNRFLAARRGRSRRPVVRTRLLGAEEDREAGAPRGGQELLGGRDGAVGKDAAGVGMTLVELIRRMRAAAIDEIVEIYREQRRPRTDEGLSPPPGIERVIGLRYDILPAVIVGLLDSSHAHLLACGVRGNDSANSQGTVQGFNAALGYARLSAA